jgi:hypothetical protein
MPWHHSQTIISAKMSFAASYGLCFRKLSLMPFGLWHKRRAFHRHAPVSLADILSAGAFFIVSRSNALLHSLPDHL